MDEQDTAKNDISNNKAPFPVFSIGLANYLCKIGYKINGVADSKYSDYYKVIYFEDSEELRRDVIKYKNKTEVTKTDEHNNISDNQQLYVVYSIKMINYLIKQGNYMVKMADSDKDTTGKYKVGLFENTEKLHKDMMKFRKEQNNIKWNK